MASIISKLWTRICLKRGSLSIMIVGLDNSGKTSLLDKLATLKQKSSLATTTTSSDDNTRQSSQRHATTDSSIRSNDGAPVAASTSPNNSEGNSMSSSSNSGGVMPTVGYNYERVHYKGLTITVLDFSGQNRYRNLWQEFYPGVDGIVFVIDSSDLIRLVVVRDELETMLNHPYFSTLRAPTDFHSAANNNEQQQQKQRQVAQVVSPITAQKQLTISQGKLIQSPLDTTQSPAATFVGSTINFSQSLKWSGQQQQPQQQQARRRTRIPILFLANKSDLPNSIDTEVITKALNLNQLPVERHPWFIQATSVNLSKGIVEGFDWLLSQLST